MLLQGALLALTAHGPMDFDTAEIRSPNKGAEADVEVSFSTILDPELRRNHFGVPSVTDSRGLCHCSARSGL